MSENHSEQVHSIITPYLLKGRSGLLPALHAVQKQFGWLSELDATTVAHSLHIPLAEVHGVIEFYTLLNNHPVGKNIIRICTDQACALKGSDQLLHKLCGQHGIEVDKVSPDGSLTIQSSPCLGLCEHAPAALIDDQPVIEININTDQLVSSVPPSRVGGSLRLITSNCGHGTTTLAKYGEYSAFLKALRMAPQDVIKEIKASGLVGRGGAAFPTGVKWEGAASTKDWPKYVVCNADESEPGTFKDRILLNDDPHQIIEGMLITAYAIGAARGYIYLRGEYPYLQPVLEQALTDARQAGYLGEDITRTGFYFDIEIRLGAGAYICGEETALFESIEGKRGFPRVKPPFPTVSGLFGKPTVINNVETLASVPIIIENGYISYRQYGTEKSTGSKLFCVSGDVNKPGLFEAPFGLTLRQLLHLAGGVSGDHAIQAVLFGGAAGAFARPDQLDVRLTFEDLRSAGLPLGSGVVMVFDETRDLKDVLRRLGKFFAHESCGKCYPCQMGTQRQKEILERLASGRLIEGDKDRLLDTGWTMTDSSLCGLGQTAASAVISAINLWPELFTHQPLSNSSQISQTP